MARLEGKVAIVTGGSRGIGQAIAARFADEGASVVVASRSGPPTGPAPSLAERALWIETDVTEAADVAALMERVRADRGRIDILVNNAGVQVEKPLDRTSDADWDWLTGVNMKGLFLACRQVIPIMRDQGGGAIINIGSISGRHADPSMALYNASKAWVHGLTRSIAVDHGRDGIRCNAIAPGLILSQPVENFGGEQYVAMLEEHHMTPRVGEADDIAHAVVFLASDEASFITGQILHVDGGILSHAPPVADLRRMAR